MNFTKKLILVIVMMAMVFSSSISVSTEGVLSCINNSVFQFDDSYEYKDNDPMYLKNNDDKNSSMLKASAISGAGNLTHNSRFSKSKKIYGVDVSYFNANIDWKKVKKSGIDFAIIRIGFRGYGNGQIVLDKKFKEYVKNAQAAGIGVGVYFYTQAINTKEAKQEAEFVLKQIKGMKLELPVYYDIEEVYGARGRLDSARLSYNAKTSLCKTFCDTIEKGGYRAGVYASYNWLTNLINGKELGKKYAIWIAHVAKSTSYKNNYDMWQYLWSGSVSGISTNVDMNVMYFVNAPKKVTNLKGSQKSDKVSLNWIKSSGAYGYAVYAKDLDTNKITEICKTTDTKKTVTIPYSRTRFYVKAYYKIGDNYCYSPYSDGVTFNLDKATNLKIKTDTYYGKDGFDFTWSKVVGASGYEIKMYDNNKKSYNIVGHTNTNEYRIQGLKPATAYKFIVRAYFNDDKSLTFDENKSRYGSDSEVFYTATKTDKTENVKVVSNKTNSINIKWDKIKGKCDGYQIYVKNCSSGKGYTAGWTAKNVNHFTIPKLSAGTKYEIKVRAYFLSNGTKYPGVYSKLVSTITICDSPKNLKASNLSSNKATLSWSKTTGANGYKIYEKVNDKVNLIGTSKSNSYTVKDLKKYSSHRYYVKTYKTFDKKEYLSGYSSGLTVNLAVAPSSFFVGNYGDKSVTLKWKKTNGADKYVVYLYNSSKKKYTAYKTVKSPSCTFTNLKNNSSVKVAVKSVYGKTYSNYSSLKTVYTRCAKPTNFKATAVGSTYQKVSWKKVSGATNYWIYKYDSKTKKYNKFKEVGNISSATLNGLKRNSAHKYKIYAVKMTSLKNYVSQGSSVLNIWTRR